MFGGGGIAWVADTLYWENFSCPLHEGVGGEDVYLHSLLGLALDVAELPASQISLWSTDIVIWLFGSSVS